MRGTRNNLLAGALVLSCAFGAVVIVVILGGALESLGKREYRVRFTIADGVTGLEAGSRVLVGGRPVGVVRGLDFEIGQTGEADGVSVVISVASANRPSSETAASSRPSAFVATMPRSNAGSPSGSVVAKRLAQRSLRPVMRRPSRLSASAWSSRRVRTDTSATSARWP